MKKSKRIMALLALLVIAVSANVVIQKINAAKEDEVLEEAGKFSLTEYEKDDISGLQWTKGDSSLSFSLSDGVWQYAQDAAFPVDQTAVKTLSDAAIGLSANRKLENIENVSDYGLDEPPFSLSIAFSDGKEVTYSLGDQTPFQDGYYLSVSVQEDSVYVIADDVSSDFSITLFDYAETETLSEVGDAVWVSLGDSFSAEYLSESKTIDKEQNWYSTLSGQPLDEEKMQSLISDIMALSLGDLQAYNASDEELSGYALTDEAAVRIHIKDTEGNERILLTGSVNDGADNYVRLENSRMVYALSSDVTDVLSVNESDMRILKVAPVSFEDIKEISFALDGKSISIERNETIMTATDGETQETTVSVRRNGVQTDGTQEETVWNIVSGINADTYAEEEAEKEEILSVTFTTNSGKTLEIHAYAYDADKYRISLSDGRNLLVSADEIDRLIRHLRQFE